MVGNYGPACYVDVGDSCFVDVADSRCACKHGLAVLGTFGGTVHCGDGVLLMVHVAALCASYDSHG
jgi:hypothetical protein